MKPKITRWHATAPSSPHYSMHSRYCPKCTYQVPYRTKGDATKSFAETGITVEVSECTCNEICRCGEGEPSGM